MQLFLSLIMIFSPALPRELVTLKMQYQDKILRTIQLFLPLIMIFSPALPRELVTLKNAVSGQNLKNNATFSLSDHDF